MQVASEERAWVEALQRKEDVACRRLVKLYLPPLQAFFRGLGFRGVGIDDLIQETFVEVWRSLKSYRGEASLRTWIFLLARRLAWKHLKRERRYEALQAQEAEDPHLSREEQDDQEEWLWIQQRNEALRACIEELPLLYREILSLHYLQEMSFLELAKILDIAEGTAKSRLSKALSLLRQAIRKHFSQHDGSER